MVSFSWQYDFVGAARTWAATIMFCATGVICGLIVPFAFSPSPVPVSLHTEGIVVRMEADDGMVRPIFQFSDQNGVTRQFRSELSKIGHVRTPATQQSDCKSADAVGKHGQRQLMDFAQ